MTTQNLVSASITAQAKAEIQQKFAEIQERLDFLLSLQSEEVHSLYKPGNGMAPFLDKAHAAALEHPHILPAVFDLEEFKKDYALSKDLDDLTQLSRQLTRGLENTQIAAKSDALRGAMEIYAAVKQHRNKVPGLNVIANELAVFFKKTHRTDKTANETAS
jgi:hypothetical protein